LTYPFAQAFQNFTLTADPELETSQQRLTFRKMSPSPLATSYFQKASTYKFLPPGNAAFPLVRAAVPGPTSTWTDKHRKNTNMFIEKMGALSRQIQSGLCSNSGAEEKRALEPYHSDLPQL